jgi:hypothetical protein
MSDTQTKAPPLANLVTAGQSQTEAVAITPFVFMAYGVSSWSMPVCQKTACAPRRCSSRIAPGRSNTFC